MGWRELRASCIESAATKSVKHRLLMLAPALTRLSYSRFDAAGGIRTRDLEIKSL